MSDTPNTTEHRYDALHLITEEVLARYSKTPDPRLRELMLSLIKHIHSFAKEVKLAAEEWAVTMSFLEETGKWCSPGRNEFMIFSDAFGLSMLTVTQDYPRPEHATEPTLVGPFLLENAPQFAMGEDISAGAAGTPMYAQGQILDIHGQPVANAVIDVWHSDDRGLYDVQDGIEENGPWARAALTTGADGRYSFWSVLPVDYPVPQDGTAIQMLQATTGRSWRPAHLHFMVSTPGHKVLITQVFADGDDNLTSDPVFGVTAPLVGHFQEHKVDGQAHATLTHDFHLTEGEMTFPHPPIP